VCQFVLVTALEGIIILSGAKLCMMLDLLGQKGTATGVDVARHRLAACRTMLLKYGLAERSRLFLADGTTFSVPPTRNLPCRAATLQHRQNNMFL
jgi:hypothetical protein